MATMIKTENLKYAYPADEGQKQTFALQGVDLRIEKGSFVVVLGHNGSGKSTLLRCVNLLETPTSGEILYHGKNVAGKGVNAPEYRSHVGMVFQSFNLLPRYTSLENVALPLIYSGVPRHIREKKARETLESVGLGERMEHKPAELSGGQRQRVAVARALINNPSIILADEPTGNLDTKTSIEIMRLFEEIYKKGNTVILVTHEEDIAQHARRIIRLRDGVIESDTTNPAPAMEI